MRVTESGHDVKDVEPAFDGEEHPEDRAKKKRIPWSVKRVSV